MGCVGASCVLEQISHRKSGVCWCPVCWSGLDIERVDTLVSHVCWSDVGTTDGLVTEMGCAGVTCVLE